MKLPSPYVCDECGTQKKESNHWYIASSGRMVFAIVAWASDDPDKKDSLHLCSESCATKALSKWMASLQSPRDNQDNARKPAGLCSYCGLPFEDHTMPTVGSGRRAHLFQSANAENTPAPGQCPAWQAHGSLKLCCVLVGGHPGSHHFVDPSVFQNARAEKPQPAKDSPKERQSTSHCQAVMTNYDQGPNIR